MQCWQCGATVRSGAKLCVYCGANLAIDAADSDASMSRRPSNSGRSERGSSSERSRRDDGWDDSSTQDDDRRSYGGGWGSRGDRRENDYRRRAEDEFEQRPRESYGRGSRDSRDPLADPRAPRNVRSTPPRDANATPRGPRDRYERRDDGERESSRDDRYENRYDARRESRQPVVRSYGEERWEPRDRSPRDRVSDRGRGGRDMNYKEDSAEFSAEYSAEYSAQYPRQDWRDESAEYGSQGRYGREEDYAEKRGRGWQDAGRGGSSRPKYNQPIEDSWNMPAAIGWTDESVRIPASPARQGAKRGRDKAADTKEQSAGKRRRAPMIIGIALVFAMLAGAGVFLVPKVFSRLHGGSGSTCAPATASVTPGAAPTPPANYKVYTDKQTGYSVPYPASWSTSSGTDTSQAQTDDVTRFAQSSSNAVFTVEHTPTFDCNTNTEIIDSEVLGGKQAGETFTELPTAGGTQTVSGEQCIRKEYSVTTSNKASLHMAIIACHHAGKGYAFVIYSDASAYSQVNTSAFQPMLTSFRFAS